MNDYTKIHFIDDLGGTFKVLNNPERKQQVLDLDVKARKHKEPNYTGITNIAIGDENINTQALWYARHIKSTGCKRLVFFSEGVKANKFKYEVLKLLGIYNFRISSFKQCAQLDIMQQLAIEDGYTIEEIPLAEYVPRTYKAQIKDGFNKPLAKPVKPYTIHVPARKLALNRI